MIGLISVTGLVCFLNLVVLVAWKPFFEAMYLSTLHVESKLCHYPCDRSPQVCQRFLEDCELATLRLEAAEKFLEWTIRNNLLLSCFYTWLFGTMYWCIRKTRGVMNKE